MSDGRPEKPPTPSDRPTCHPRAFWLWAWCGWPGHPGAWSCGECATHREEPTT